MPSSSSAATRPLTLTLPVVGWVVPVISLSSVLLPAPLMPMIPTAWPGSRAKEMSCSTHFREWRGRAKGSTHSARRCQRDGYCR